MSITNYNKLQNFQSMMNKNQIGENAGIVWKLLSDNAHWDYEKLKDHPLIDATTIGLKGSPTNIFKSFTPPQKGVGMMLDRKSVV